MEMTETVKGLVEFFGLKKAGGAFFVLACLQKLRKKTLAPALAISSFITGK
jgi:hypothetical protein